MSVYIGSVPVSPLISINWSEISCLPINTDTIKIFFRTISSPNFYIFLIQFICISRSFYKPKKLFSNSSPKYFFMSQQWKSMAQIISHHLSKKCFCSCSCSIWLILAFLYYFFNCLYILIFLMLRLLKKILSWSLISWLIVK